MTTEQIRIVQRTFDRVRPNAADVAASFYEHLFEIAPEVRPMFRSDMEEQGRKLIGMLAIVVAGLDRLDHLLPAVSELGRRHAGYGVRDEHYRPVGEASLRTLEQALGPDFTADARSAWTTAYRLLAGTMKQSAALANAA